LTEQALENQPGSGAPGSVPNQGGASGQTGQGTSSGTGTNKALELTPDQLKAQVESLTIKTEELEKVLGTQGQKLEGYRELREVVDPIWDQVLELREKHLKGSEQSQALEELTEQLSQANLPPKVVEALTSIMQLVPTLQKRQTAIEAKQDLQDYFDKNPDKKDLKPKMMELIDAIRTKKTKDIDIISLAAAGMNLSQLVDQRIANMSDEEMERKKAASALSHRSGTAPPLPEKAPEKDWKTEKANLLARAKQKSTFPAVG